MASFLLNPTARNRWVGIDNMRCFPQTTNCFDGERKHEKDINYYKLFPDVYLYRRLHLRKPKNGAEWKNCVEAGDCQSDHRLHDLIHSQPNGRVSPLLEHRRKVERLVNGQGGTETYLFMDDLIASVFLAALWGAPLFFFKNRVSHREEEVCNWTSNGKPCRTSQCIYHNGEIGLSEALGHSIRI